MVNKTIVLIRSYLKKSLSQVIALIVLFTFSALLLNTFLYIQTDYAKNFERTCDKLDTEDISLVYYNLINVDQKENVKEVLDSLDYVSEYEVEDIISGSGASDFADGELDNIFSICSYDEIKNKKIGRYEILNNIDSSGVILSYLFDVSAGYKINDTISFRVNENKYEYKIVGFYNNTTTGTINCPDVMVIVTDDIYEEIKKDANPSVRIELNVKSDNDIEETINKITDEIAKKVPVLSFLYGNDIDTVENNRYSNAVLFEVILSAAAIVMIAVLLIIIFISLNNYIANSTRDLGTLKAIGYTSNNLIIPIVFILTLISIISSLVGASLSYCILPLINMALESQIGIPYEVRFIVLPLILSVLVVASATFITAFLSVIKIRNIAPINAIRENKTATTKSSKIITIDKTNIGVNTLIGLKGFFSSVGRNIVILIAITAVSFLAGFTCFMYQNVIKDNTGVLELICGQIANSTLTVEVSHEDILKEELKKNKDVEEFYLYSVSSITPKDYPLINTYIVEKSSYLNSNTILLDGKLPEKENEIAINGCYAKEYDLQIGDEIIINGKDGDLNLTICGITQGAFYTGKDCFVLRKTYEKISDLYTVSYYVDLKEDVDIDEFNNDISDSLPKLIKNYVNQDKFLQSTAAMYSSILYILAAVICVLSLLIIIFVLYILIYILLRNKRREHGILKSIGYTSNEIIYQTILTILPTSLISIITGLLLSKDGVKELLSTALNSIGIFRFGQSINTTYLLIAGIFLTLFTIIYTLLLSLSIKKISPHDLFNNE